MPERGIAGTVQRYKQVVGDDSQFCRQLARWTYKDLHWHTQLNRKMVTHIWYMLLLQKKITKYYTYSENIHIHDRDSNPHCEKLYMQICQIEQC